MLKWLPLVQIEPFAAVMRSAKLHPAPAATEGRPIIPTLYTEDSSGGGQAVILVLFLILGLVFLGAVGYIGHMEGWWKALLLHYTNTSIEPVKDRESDSGDSHRKASGFDSQSIERMRHWTSVELRSILKIGHEGYEIVHNKTFVNVRESFETNLELKDI